MEFEVGFPYIMIKSEKFVEFVKKFGRKHRKAIAIYAIAGFLIAMFASAFGFMFLFDALQKARETGKAQVSLLIPGVKVPGTNYRLPLVKGLLIIFLIAIFHEGSHALVGSALEVIPKYFALILFAIIPAAGVEFDEEKLKKEKKFKRMLIYSAGSMGNFVLALLAILLFFGLAKVSWVFVEYNGVKILNTTNPALENYTGKVIVAVNGTIIKTVEDLGKYLSSIKPNNTLLIKFSDNTTAIARTHGKERAWLGIYISQQKRAKLGIISEFYIWLVGFLWLLANLSVGVGIVNMLPLPPLDGGRIYDELLPERDGWRLLKKCIFITTLILLLINLAWPLIGKVL